MSPVFPNYPPPSGLPSILQGTSVPITHKLGLQVGVSLSATIQTLVHSSANVLPIEGDSFIKDTECSLEKHL